jgi:EAL and modified HD-GYP domain-containing signal transduction protein
MQDELFKQDEQFEPIFVARQPIFDRNQNIWGYELLFRHSGTAGTAKVTDPDVATAKVIADGFTLALTGMPPGRRTLINFPQNLILRGTAYALPKDICVVEILETVKATPEIVDACKKIKEAGYILALDDFVGQPGFEEILKIADIVKVEILGQSTPNIIKISQSLKKSGTKLLAEKIEDQKAFQLTKSLGYEYFQGYYFSKPEIIPGRKISASQISKMRLLQALTREDAETKELAKIIEGDLSLSYRILRFMNSAAFGLAKTLTSVEQAVSLLGRRPLKQWIMVVSLSDLAPTPRAEELSFQSIQRGRYLETLVSAMPKPIMPKDTAFLLGLFSKLDALLNQPMEQILGDLPLEDDIKSALVGQQNPARKLLNFLEAVEAGAWDTTAEALAAYGVNQADAAVLYAKSTSWTQKILGQSKEEDKAA